MVKKDVEKNNLIFLFIGYFFVFASGVLISFFLPFYLKEQGMSILAIGGLLTFGIALGMLVFGFLFGRIQRKIKLKAGLYLSAIFYFFNSILLFFIPGSMGVISSKVSGSFGNSISKISSDVTMQHNSYKKIHRKLSSIHLIVDSFSIVFGLFISIILIKYIGFRNSLLFFALLIIPSFFFFSKINENTRFKSNKKFKDLKLNKKLKLLFIAENIHWFALSSSFALVITFLITDKFSASINWLAYLFSGLYISIMLTTFLTRKFLDKLNLYKTSIFGMILLFLSAIIIILANNIYYVFGALILEGISAGIWVPSKTALYWKETSPELREKASGYLMGWRSFAKAMGPLAGGILVTYLGILAPFYLKSVIALCAIGIYYYLLKN